MTAPAASGTVLTPGQIAYEAKAAGFPDDQIKIAVAVALAESGGRLNAHNSKPPDDSYGLWQINMYGALGPARRAQFGIQSNEALYGSAVNARAAKKIWDGSGWRAWSTYTSGAYNAFLVFGALGAANPTPTNVVSAEEQGGVDTQIGGKIPDLFKEAILWVLKQLSPILLRVGGFVGGGILVIVAVVLYVRGQK